MGMNGHENLNTYSPQVKLAFSLEEAPCGSASSGSTGFFTLLFCISSVFRVSNISLLAYRSAGCAEACVFLSRKDTVGNPPFSSSMDAEINVQFRT